MSTYESIIKLLTNNMISQNNENWNKYWGLINQRSEVVWDADANLGIGLEIDFLQNNLKNSDLPLIDFGCGDGNMTQFLAKYFAQVIGVDVAQNALNLAEIEAKKAGLDIKYQLVDTDEKIQQLHQNIGDANVYVRSVLHQIEASKRPLLVENLKTLIGKKGTLFLIEITDQSEDRFPKQTKTDDPSKVRRLLDCGIKPGFVKQEEIHDLFPAPDFSILEMGILPIPMNATIQGQRVIMDYLYAVITTTNHN